MFKSSWSKSSWLKSLGLNLGFESWGQKVWGKLSCNLEKHIGDSRNIESRIEMRHPMDLDLRQIVVAPSVGV